MSILHRHGTEAVAGPGDNPGIVLPIASVASSPVNFLVKCWTFKLLGSAYLHEAVVSGGKACDVALEARAGKGAATHQTVSEPVVEGPNAHAANIELLSIAAALVACDLSAHKPGS